MIFLFCLPLLTAASNEFGVNFLIGNKEKDGVITLPSGLQYKVLRAGGGTDHPTANSPCICDYEGRIAENYPSGRKFDSSYDRGQPATFAPNQVIAGWTEAMQLMVEGDKWEMYIPSNLAYGDRGSPPAIPGGAVLVFTMEILKINGKKVPAKKDKAVSKPAGAKLEGTSVFKLVFNVANLVGEPSEGSFTIEVHPEWAPLGAKRMQELVEDRFFDDVRFFRVIDGFMAQFGIHGDPSVMQQWRGRTIRDDPAFPGVGNKRGTISFATSGKDSRTTQIFVNFGDNSRLDGMGFTPVAEVVEGMDVVDRLFKIGEGAPSGPGPSQGTLQARGNAYLNKDFPQLSYVKSCKILSDVQNAPSSKFLEKSADAQSATNNVLLAERSTGIANAASTVKDFGDGLKLTVTQAGDGKTFPHAGDLLTMHYTLTLADDSSGRIIDSSRSRNEPFSFYIGRNEVISGWDKGVMKMSLGERGMLTVPAHLGYGVTGAGDDIPPNTDLVFDVEVLGIGDLHSPTLDSDPLGKNMALGVAFCVAGIMVFVAVHIVCKGAPTEKSIRRTIEMTVGKAAPE